MNMQPARPIYLKAAQHTLFGLFHAPQAPDPAKAAVLICPPWGWEETASYRTRRDWAQRLARAGHPTLRFAFPGTGDSSGSPEDPDLVQAWVASIEVAARWLRATSGCSSLAALGLGLGGLLAIDSLAIGASIDQLALWATPAAGRNFVRETRVFSRLQAWRSAEEGSPLPEGWLEAGGFVLSSASLEALGRLDPDPAQGNTPRRALLLGRDGVEPDQRLCERLQGAGAEVSVDPGRGWGAMVSHPERSTLGLEVADRFEAWLAAAEATARTQDKAAVVSLPPGPMEVAELEIELGGRCLREVALTFEQNWGQAFGVLASPLENPVSGLCAICLNAGAVREIGPSRMWVQTARAWAARGVPTLRLDLQGIGEADGEPSGVLRVADFYVPRYEAQVDAVLDVLQEREPETRFMLVGLCAGGYWAFRAAVRDERVRTAVLINAGALRWDVELLAEREARKASRALDRRWWGRLLRGEIELAKLRRLARSLLVKAARFLRGLGPRLFGPRRDVAKDGIEADLDRLRDSGTRLTIAFSAEEPLGVELEAAGIEARIGDWPNVELRALPGSDHTLRPISAQVAAGELLERELSRAPSLLRNS